MPSPQLLELILIQTNRKMKLTDNQQKSPIEIGLFYSAESEGFEPPEPRGSIVFKTTAIDHSANSPRQK